MARYSIAPYNIVIQEKGPEQRETLPRDKMRLWKFSQIELELKQYFFIPAVCVFIGSRRLNMKNAYLSLSL